METWLISDTHFSHSNILNFKKENGEVLRKFHDIYHMDEYMISAWNSVVKTDDKVYHLGDVGFSNFTNIENIFRRLNGNKVLIKGNHDYFKLSQYQKIFKDVRAYHVLDKIALAHIPIHPESLSRWKGQIHGHTHSNSLKDPRYYNVSVEVIDYIPVNFDDIRKYYETIRCTTK